MDFLFDWFAFWLEYIWQFLFGKSIESLPLELENGEGKVEKTIYTNEQQKRKVKCRTKEGKYFEVPWCLMMQSKIFSDMWTNLGQEEIMFNVASKQGINADNKEHKNIEEDPNLEEPFVFNLPTISKKCFRRIVDWMRHRHGQPEFELQFGQETGQQIWFQPDEWERHFGFGDKKNKMDLEEVKELYLAANFLDLPSLFHYCIQEFAFAVIHAKKLEQVREILCLVDDLTQEEKAAILLEFDIPVQKSKQKKKQFSWEIESEIVRKLEKPLPPELVHPIFAKLSLSDQRWLLPLNRNVYKYLADRVRKNWPKWMDILKNFIIDENPNWYGLIPNLEDDLHSDEWTASHLLTDRALQTEILLTQQFVAQKFDSIKAEQIDELDNKRIIKNRLKSVFLKAIEHMEGLFRTERHFQQELEEILKPYDQVTSYSYNSGLSMMEQHRQMLEAKHYENITSMNCYKRGIFHLLEQRRQILEELETDGMKELKKNFSDLEKSINDYWVKRL